MKSSLDIIPVVGINPFDKFYDHLQQVFDQNVIKLITEILELNLTVVTTPLITDLGSYEENPDNWVVEQISNSSAELSSSTIVLTPESQEIISYSFDISSFRPLLYYKARSLREGHNIYLKPFSSELWLCLAITVCLLIAALTLILSRESKLPHEISYDVLARIIDVQQDKDEEFAQDLGNTSKEVLLQKEKWEMGEILLVCLGAPCQQGSARDPSTNAARIVILCMFGVAVVGYTAYSASLISIVSLFPSTEREQTRNAEYFSRKYSTFLHHVNNVKDLKLDFVEVEFADLEKGFRKVLQGDAVFIGDRDTSLTFFNEQKFNANVRCTLGRNFLGLEYQRVLALKKPSKYREKINLGILKLKEFGLLKREREKVFNIKSPCSRKVKLSTSNFVSFNKNDVEPISYLYISGALISLLLLLVENTIFLCSKEIKNFSIKI